MTIEMKIHSTARCQEYIFTRKQVSDLLEINKHHKNKNCQVSNITCRKVHYL